MLYSILSHECRVTGFRWAPRTFLGQSGNFITGIPGSESGIAGNGYTLKTGETVEGFVVDFPGVILGKPKAIGSEHAIYVRQKGKLFKTVLKLGPGLFQFGTKHQYAIVLGTIPKAKFTEPVPSIFGQLKGSTEGGIMRVGYVCLAESVVCDDDIEEDYETAMVGKNEQWCVT